jgi:hypothetical protein
MAGSLTDQKKERELAIRLRRLEQQVFGSSYFVQVVNETIAARDKHAKITAAGMVKAGYTEKQAEEAAAKEADAKFADAVNAAQAAVLTDR